MSLIQCDADCVYQKDGYCLLDTPSPVTNYTGKGCVHCIRTKKAEVTRTSPPQTPPARF